MNNGGRVIPARSAIGSTSASIEGVGLLGLLDWCLARTQLTRSAWTPFGELLRRKAGEGRPCRLGAITLGAAEAAPSCLGYQSPTAVNP